jgi:histone-lysine N-methyltransferase SETD1
MYAARNIAPGEELTYDYQFNADEKPVCCRCGTTACRGTLNLPK